MIINFDAIERKVIVKQDSISLLEFSYDEIKKRIQSGIYAPGSKIVIQEISDSLKVSRTPVISAINRLLAEGYIENIAQKGTFVKSLSIRDIRNTLEMRIMIELYAVKPAIKNIIFCPTIIQEMREILKEYKDIQDNDYDRLCDVECHFHHLYISLIGNEKIMQMYKQNRCIAITYHMYKMTSLPLTNMKKTYDEHCQIVDYLENQDENAMTELLKTHIRTPMEALDWLIKNDYLPS